MMVGGGASLFVCPCAIPIYVTKTVSSPLVGKNLDIWTHITYYKIYSSKLKQTQVQKQSVLCRKDINKDHNTVCSNCHIDSMRIVMRDIFRFIFRYIQKWWVLPGRNMEQEQRRDILDMFLMHLNTFDFSLFE